MNVENTIKTVNINTEEFTNSQSSLNANLPVQDVQVVDVEQLFRITDCWKIITSHLNFKGCVRTSWVSKTWKFCIERTDVFLIQRKIFFGKGSHIKGEKFENLIAVNLFCMNSAILFMNSPGLSTKLISQYLNISTKNVIEEGFESHLKLSRLGLCSHNDIIKFGTFYEKYMEVNQKTPLAAHWKNFMKN